ncbi:DUF1684 domain-containing protein [Streptomyces sp. H27-D2]|uniref:DUF1684 domain-containing protein n=1 Tax=Streptomyces sp. H27-D2 TaxID=3046304 RepID=UPI002DBC86C7|nr:DUF1684 domain-containing protein [Streptomyces sp. H27-D2]MEC4019599.1 DUF1684 domain-containing protein [Streptomyces sp. H27-D2]
MSTDSARRNSAQQQWKVWREQRSETISEPYGPLALTGTYWLSDAPEGRIPDVPGRWTEDGDAVLLQADPDSGPTGPTGSTDPTALTVSGQPLNGEVRLGADAAGPDAARVAHGERRLVVLRREGLWAVRVFDPLSAGRRAFAGIDAFEYDERWALPAVFRPYGEDRTVQVPDADGRARGLGLGGELVFRADGGEHTLAAAVEADGSLWIVLADATSGNDSYRFRFLRPPAPAADGSVTVDFNRTLLPPCAFAEHFICPFPPPGNTLPFALRAGERNVLTR